MTPMMPEELKPSRLEKVAAGIYACGTSFIYSDTIREELLMPLLTILIEKIRNADDETNETISTCISYLFLVVSSGILATAQYSSNIKSIAVYNQQQAELKEVVGFAEDSKSNKNSSCTATVGAAIKSAAAGISFWKLCKKIPWSNTVGNIVGGISSALAFSGSFFSQRKVLGLKPQTDLRKNTADHHPDEKIDIVVQQDKISTDSNSINGNESNKTPLLRKV